MGSTYASSTGEPMVTEGHPTSEVMTYTSAFVVTFENVSGDVTISEEHGDGHSGSWVWAALLRALCLPAGPREGLVLFDATFPRTSWFSWIC